VTQIYHMINADGFELCLPVDGTGYDTVRQFTNGDRPTSSWTPLHVYLCRQDDGQHLVKCDTPWWGANALILRPRAMLALAQIWAKNGELLPLQCHGARLSLFMTKRRLHALDENASSITRFRDGRIMRVDRHVFREDIVGEHPVFMLEQDPGCLFFSKRFVDLWHAAELTGIEFRQVWPELLAYPKKTAP
jgi:hypothetical protein